MWKIEFHNFTENYDQMDEEYELVMSHCILSNFKNTLCSSILVCGNQIKDLALAY